jgi:acyl transferase domain-containing protein/NAD(P)H-dependent flavin oxidoreductase YrpB (nitropropane dioxygenase family)/NAD(P)-dependent dehydrogenase (short-subunit alcohol dehydrogenase family)
MPIEDAEPRGFAGVLPRIVGITPFETPDARLAIALAEAGALGVLDLGRDAKRALTSLADVDRRLGTLGSAGFGVRIPEGVDVASLPEGVRVVVVPSGVPIAPWLKRTVLVQVTSVDEVEAALLAGADGLIAKGSESGGRVGAEPTLILLQRILRTLNAARLAGGRAVPVWAQGGVGLHTAGACIVAGARGVVFDGQLALLREASTTAAVRRAIAAMDGSETRVVGAHRIYGRPSMPPPPPGTSAEQIAAGLKATDPSTDLLAAGQDACFAKPMADRFLSVAGFTRGITKAIAGHIRQAKTLAPLGRDSRFCAEHGLTYPILQGPMTRVSDRASFADAVSRGGGLPFLALSLMRGNEARELLRETAALHGERTWGVGILGFVPPEIRDEQLALVLEAKPKVALIAGGRPSQARPLEEAGIATYLHVPSPGLLDLFLKDGARRFIFEGRECGGHVGPRSSFVLWETAIERLLAEASLSDVSVVFAGGIHDGLSAAMVSVMAAPLVARGAKIAVLMGTAYLFTEEAVSSGAILPAFQEEALRCRDTVLLETAPGHATRAADTSFARSFLEERRRLESEGKTPQEIWEALEQFNLGRLRVAAKGLERQTDGIVSVDKETQRREGLFMIGQVATLRTALCSIADLHREVSEGAALRLADAVVPEGLASREKSVDVAIVGMACVFPGAGDLPSFWTNLVLGKNAIGEVPDGRWSSALYYDPAGGTGKTPSKWGGFLDDVAFDPSLYGIPPRSLPAVDPVQLLSLEVARRALADAGYAAFASDSADRPFDRDRTSVVFGAESGADLANAYGFRSLFPQMCGPVSNDLDAHLPKLTEDSFPGMLANVIAGRIANRLDLGGVNYTVDAACASSLAAVDVACKELALGTSDMVIAGGADLHNGVNDYLLFASVHALSPSGQCKSFDRSADGIVLGEGVAALVLKRLSDAERDGDRVYAVIKGMGASSDGKSLGLTAPRKEGQTRALERAYDRAGISPAEVGLIEAHGTGTVVGDKTELGTLTDFFGADGAVPHGCSIGSVKSHIGHTKCAAGLAGLIKASLALYHRVLPPTGNLESPNLSYDPGSSPFVFRTNAAPWLSDKRHAGVSAFGFGGTNFHAVLTAHDRTDRRAGLDAWPSELFVFRGNDRATAERTAASLAALLADGERSVRLRDLARSVAETGRGPVQIAFVADTLVELGNKLGSLVDPSGADSPGVFVRDPARSFCADQVALLFPGQGSQRPGMLAELFIAFPELCDVLKPGAHLVDRLFPGAAFTPEENAEQKRALTDTCVAQPALGMVDLAMARLLGRLGVRGAMLGGHSYGEIVALTVAGVLPESSLVTLSEARARAIVEAAGGEPGTMAAVSAPAGRVREALVDLDGVTLANLNAPEQTVIAGACEVIESACAHLASAGIAARKIPVACAFHSPIVAGAVQAFARCLADVSLGKLACPVYGNTTAQPYPGDAGAIRAQLAQQLALPVRFAEQIEAMYAAGARVFVEAGPGCVLTDLVGRILGGRPHVAVACDGPAPRQVPRAQPSPPHGITCLLYALAQLSVAGADLDVAKLFDGRDARAFDLASPPRVGPGPTAWLVSGLGARPRHGDLPEGAMHMPTKPLVVSSSPDPVRVAPRENLASGAATSAMLGGAGPAVLEYLQNMRAIVEGQRQVMLQFLGGTASTVTVTHEAQVAPPQPTAPIRATLSLPRHTPDGGPTSDAVPTVRVPLSPLQALIATVSERTGYPPEMLDPDLDMEADLGIDSIKRVEILGLMRDKLDLKALNGTGRSEVLEQLAGVKTLRKIATWLEEHIAGPNGPSANGASSVNGVAHVAHLPAASAAGTTPQGAASVSSPSVSSNLGAAESEPPSGHRGATDQVARYVFELNRVPDAVPNCVRVTGRTFAVVPDAYGVASKLAALLESRGARVKSIGPEDHVGQVDGLLHLASLSQDSQTSLGPLFSLAKEAAEKNAKWIVAATGLGGSFGHAQDSLAGLGGVSGLLKSVAKERPELKVRAIDLHPGEDHGRLAEHIYAELLADDARVEVGYRSGVRQTLTVVPREPLAKKPQLLRLDENSVVLVTGGARGITAEVAVALARRFQCRLELVGRSPLPGDEEAELASATDAPAIRRLLLRRTSVAEPDARSQDSAPAAIERLCKQVLVDRDIRRTVRRIRDAGAQVTYHSVDVRDEDAFGTVIDEIYARTGRIDGVVHGAGVIEDKLLVHKTRGSFDRVFETKVRSAHTLARKLRDDVRFIAFFSSVSGAFGSRGQADYAAANDALDKLAHRLRQTRSARVLSVNWGPWGGVGMVSPELGREYARRGVNLIPPEQGAARFVEELCRGDDAQVVLMAPTSESLG